MNKFYLSVALVLSFNFSFSAPVIKSVKDGYWNQASTWNLNRTPEVGDTIVIVAGNTITVNNDISLNAPSFLKIYGKLAFQNNNSTLSLSSGSFVWVFSGGMIMGGGSASQKLRLDGTSIFDGDDDPVYGPVMASVSSGGFAAMVNAAPITLPVKFLEFTISKTNNDALIQWSTSQEINASMYEVQRSVNGNDWNTIAYVLATGNSSTINNYSYTDNSISATVSYYRIKEVDVDGKTTLTSTKSIKSGITTTASNIQIAAMQKKVLLQFPQQISGNLVVRFVSRNGQVLDQQSISNPVGQVVLNSKLTGLYIISISNGQQINIARQVML
ncbi:MAG TPA: G8 domain-containing protein [Flavisolibacter sp.]|jgi:hypothetical protein|nr:G8 domain-containing protein [Flavisolibacter sp.]